MDNPVDLRYIKLQNTNKLHTKTEYFNYEEMSWSMQSKPTNKKKRLSSIRFGQDIVVTSTHSKAVNTKIHPIDLHAAVFVNKNLRAKKIKFGIVTRNDVVITGGCSIGMSITTNISRINQTQTDNFKRALIPVAKRWRARHYKHLTHLNNYDHFFEQLFKTRVSEQVKFSLQPRSYEHIQDNIGSIVSFHVKKKMEVVMMSLRNQLSARKKQVRVRSWMI